MQLCNCHALGAAVTLAPSEDVSVTSLSLFPCSGLTLWLRGRRQMSPHRMTKVRREVKCTSLPPLPPSPSHLSPFSLLATTLPLYCPPSSLPPLILSFLLLIVHLPSSAPLSLSCLPLITLLPCPSTLSLSSLPLCCAPPFLFPLSLPFLHCPHMYTHP